ncbi:hypothetical protein MK535_00690 [Streptococcus anginosus]|uniref:hypothetical protein n=1 Tax=Streptococcus anginosus TaxID=1328 RepID=UPI0022851945|nr:hypothetical protein [Streptococcus anginosus]MCY7231895.1 hypothetical protein [Streptococcus anginosus]
MDKLKVDEKLEHMKKRKLRISSIEIIAILGLLIWLLTIFLRKYYSINSVVPMINTSVVFDVYDVLATVLAEIIAFSILVILKEKTLIDYR